MKSGIYGASLRNGGERRMRKFSRNSPYYRLGYELGITRNFFSHKQKLDFSHVSAGREEE